MQAGVFEQKVGGLDAYDQGRQLSVFGNSSGGKVGTTNEDFPTLVIPERKHLWMENPSRLKHELDGVRVDELIQHIGIGLVEVRADNCTPDIFLGLNKFGKYVSSSRGPCGAKADVRILLAEPYQVGLEGSVC